MALITCPECGGEISDKAVVCPKCGFIAAGVMKLLEYRSKTTIFGLPLVHVIWGPAVDLTTGLPRVAKGIIAAGPVAVGGLAFGGVSIGLVGVGGLGLGLCAFGGAAVGGLFAAGGAALGYVAIGGAAAGVHVLCGFRQDPAILDFFKNLFGS